MHEMDGGRGQSALEYLGTYSWAILIMVLAVAAIYYFGVTNPVSLLPTSCDLPSDLGCRVFIVHTNGSIYLDIAQNTGHDINVTHFKCYESLNATMGASNALDTQVTVLNGGNAVVMNGGNYSCVKKDGTNVTGRAGEAFKGYIFIQYTELDTNFTHVATGNIFAKLE